MKQSAPEDREWRGASRAAVAAASPGTESVASADLPHIVADLRSARRALAARPRAAVVAALTDVVDAWLAPGSPWMARAVAILPEATGFSAAMVRYALPTMLEPLRPPALAELLAAEAAGSRAPELILHVLPGNLPGLAAIPAVLSLAVGSAALLKTGRGDRVFPPLFVSSIAARDAELGACVHASYWPGGDRVCEDAVLSAADLVVAAGDDRTIAALARRARGRFVGHGHRVSFALVSEAIAAEPQALERAAAALARDVAIWDQRGCLSPQFCLVEGDLDRAQAFGERVADALRPLAGQLPPARLSSEERLAVRRFRDQAEWRGLAGEAVRVITHGAEGDGTVVIEALPRVYPTPLNRSLCVMPVAQLGDIGPLLAPARGLLEGAGLAAPSGQWAVVAARLSEWGVHRVCPLGEMQRPPLAWRQGGRPRLADWLQ